MQVEPDHGSPALSAGDHEIKGGGNALDRGKADGDLRAPREPDQSLRRTFFTMPEKLSSGRSPVVISPRMKTSERPARVTSPVHSTSSPSWQPSRNSPLRDAVTEPVPSR